MQTDIETNIRNRLLIIKGVTMKTFFSKNQGNALIMTVIITFMFFIFAGSLLTMSMFSNNTNTNVYEREQARIIARSTVLSLKEYMENEGDKSFSTVGVPDTGGASNISASTVSIKTDTGSLGEADNIRINVVDKSSSQWEVTIWATGYYPSIDSSISGVDASVTFDMLKSSNNTDGILSDLDNNVLNALTGDINFSGYNIVGGSVYAGGNINAFGATYFLRGAQSDANYIKAGGNINFSGGYRFDVDGIEAGGSIVINSSQQENWPNNVLSLEDIGITAPSTSSFHSTVFKTPVQFETMWTQTHFEGGNATLIYTPQTRINFMPADIPLELREVATVNDLDLLQPIEILMNEVPNGENFPLHDINSGIDITEDVKLTGTLRDNSSITIDASRNDIVIYVDTPIILQEGSYIIIDDGRDYTGENSNSVVFIIADGGELIFSGAGIRLNNIYNTEIPQVYFISNSYSNILFLSTTSSVKGFVIAPNSTVSTSNTSTRDLPVPNFHGFIIASEINLQGSDHFVLWESPIKNTMDRVTSRYIREVRGGSND